MIEDSKGAAMAEEVAGEVTGADIENGAAAEGPKEAALAADAKAEVIGEEVKSEPAAPQTVPTIREIFGMPEKGVADPSDERWKAVEERLSEEVKGIKWTAAMSDLAPKLCDLLEIKIPDVLLAAWKKARELQEVIEKSKLTPEEITYLELADHSINSEHKPSIDVKLRGAKVKTIALLVQMGFKLKGFVLKIQNGGIVEIQTGHCEAKGTIKYAGLAIAEKKLEPIKLPLSIPIAIPASASIPTSIPASIPLVAVAEDANKDPGEAVERIEL